MATEPHFEIQRIYVKDLSFEAPNTPHTFIEEWKPEVSLNLETKNSKIQDNTHEVILSVTATVNSSSKSAFLVEVQQAGIFVIKNVPANDLNQILSTFCPTILFPYAREAISDAVTRGGFPQLILAPVNFDALYMQHMEKQKEPADSSGVQGEGEGKIH